MPFWYGDDDGNSGGGTSVRLVWYSYIKYAGGVYSQVFSLLDSISMEFLY